MADHDSHVNAVQGSVIQQSLQIPPVLAGMRFDRALAELMPNFSRSCITGWIREGKVTLNDRVVRPRDIVLGGESVRCDVVLQPQVTLAPEDLPLDICYQDEHILVLNKPPGLVVHPGAGNPTGTLQHALLHFDARLAEIPRAGIVHRLDKDTSGIMIVARTLTAHHHLVAALAERTIHRQYEALVQGAMVAGGTVNAAIGRHPRDRIKMAVVEHGKPAVTHYRVKQRFFAHTLLQVQLETGRTHQIRVHLASIRHPIVGDAVYGSGLKLPRGASTQLADALRAFRRQALHAERIQFAHPVSGELMDICAPRPADFDALIAAFEAEYHTT